MTAAYPETAEEIQAAARTFDWQITARLYQLYREQGKRAAAAALLERVRKRYGPRMAEGLVEWVREER